MKAEELAFWIQWYVDWQAALVDGARSVRVSDHHVHHAQAGFEETVLRLDALVERARSVPAPAWLRQKLEGMSLDEPLVPEREEGTDWPPGVAREVAAKLRSLVRAPYFYANADGMPDMADIAARESLARLVAGVRAAMRLRACACSDDEERERIRRNLLDALAEGMFRDAVRDLHFLPAQEVDAAVAASGSDRLAIAPFQRFVGSKPPADLLCVSDGELEYEAWRADTASDPDYDPKPEPTYCEGCDQPLDPQLDYCWTCQCEGADWD